MLDFQRAATRNLNSDHPPTPFRSAIPAPMIARKLHLLGLTG